MPCKEKGNEKGRGPKDPGKESGDKEKCCEEDKQKEGGGEAD